MQTAETQCSASGEDPRALFEGVVTVHCIECALTIDDWGAYCEPWMHIYNRVEFLEELISPNQDATLQPIAEECGLIQT